jgi:hypothetical protein
VSFNEKVYFAVGSIMAEFIARLIWWVEYCLKMEVTHEQNRPCNDWSSEYLFFFA